MAQNKKAQSRTTGRSLRPCVTLGRAPTIQLGARQSGRSLRGRAGTTVARPLTAPVLHPVGQQLQLVLGRSAALPLGRSPEMPVWHETPI